jgi:glutathione S-transferase
MADICLYHMPGACSRVSLNALEEAKADFIDQPVNIFKGEQRTPEYLAINPNGRVPALKVGSQILTENAAILIYLDERFPDAHLLPPTQDPMVRAQNRSDLIWASNTLHPLVRTQLFPQRVAPAAPESAREAGAAQLNGFMPRINERLAKGWWYGDTWSVMDVYLFWIMGIVALGKFDFTPYPAIAPHTERVRARPSFQRALKRELAAVERGGIELPPGASL